MGNSVVEAARKYLGTPFHHQGRSTAGLDCAGLVVCAYRDAGIAVRDTKGYARTPYKGLMASALSASFQPVKEPNEGDVLLMAFVDEPQHVAIYAGKTIIHCYEKAGKVIEHRFAKVWQARVRGVYRRV